MIFRERGTCKTDNQLIFSGDPGIDKVCLVEIEKKLRDIFKALVKVEPNIAAGNVQPVFARSAGRQPGRWTVD